MYDLSDLRACKVGRGGGGSCGQGLEYSMYITVILLQFSLIHCTSAKIWPVVNARLVVLSSRVRMCVACFMIIDAF